MVNNFLEKTVQNSPPHTLLSTGLPPLPRGQEVRGGRDLGKATEGGGRESVGRVLRKETHGNVRDYYYAPFEKLKKTPLVVLQFRGRRRGRDPAVAPRRPGAQKRIRWERVSLSENVFYF